MAAVLSADTFTQAVGAGGEHTHTSVNDVRRWRSSEAGLDRRGTWGGAGPPWGIVSTQDDRLKKWFSRLNGCHSGDESWDEDRNGKFAVRSGKPLLKHSVIIGIQTLKLR